ncbi:hypothetical protein H310_06428 [Aphanomyces invadans]|uniref:Lipoyl-binding domain-containing protein n=1 Tax=Aphanomyces invadans TaxID=157072 RepID=A0A024U6H1_9STRA|nr:hypothetical protein H310_06428 [Aphanomyces invadans]ETW01859.1 hypothetical protein H310_06428 [Aphanomyces invadans]|eukprot:XP_008869707.1 hypothetical protein H310_06428 [Aphanomyces invadans]
MLFLRRGSLLRAAAAVYGPRRWCHANSSKLPEHIKIRMLDMDITQTIEGSKLLRWFAKEGDKIGPGKPICEVDTPELLFSIESEDEGYIAKIFVPAQSERVRPNEVLAVIVPTESDIPPFLEALAEHPDEIEVHKPSTPSIATSESTPTDGADLLRVLSHLNKEGAFPSEDVYKTLKSLARKNDDQLLLVYKGSFDEDNTTSGFDKDFFIENCIDLVDEKKSGETTT